MIPRLIGMVHLAPLPGAPAYVPPLSAAVGQAVTDARTLADAGFDAVMVENFGDAPFFADDVPKVTVAAMTRAVTEIAANVDIPVGVNVLRNDAEAALAVATASGASFIRVNVLSGAMHTDQGPIVGKAAHLARLRSSLGSDCWVLADVFVKHAVPPAGLGIEQAAIDLWERSGADAIVVSGSGTGRPVDPERLRLVRAAVPDAPIYVGSGATAETVDILLGIADGAIVGSALKPEGKVEAPIDMDLAAAFVAAAKGS